MHSSWPYTNKNIPKTKNNNELIIAAECLPNFHNNFFKEFIREKKFVLVCPKNDSEIVCLNKIVEALSKNPTSSITICKLKLKCCKNLTKLVQQAMKIAEINTTINEKTYDTNGKLIR